MLSTSRFRSQKIRDNRRTIANIVVVYVYFIGAIYSYYYCNIVVVVFLYFFPFARSFNVCFDEIDVQQHNSQAYWYRCMPACCILGLYQQQQHHHHQTRHTPNPHQCLGTAQKTGLFNVCVRVRDKTANERKNYCCKLSNTQ